MAEAKKSYADMTEEEAQYAMVLGARIAHAREGLGISQGELGKLAGFNQTTISLIETGKRLPNLKTLIRLSKIIKKSLKITLE